MISFFKDDLILQGRCFGNIQKMFENHEKRKIRL